MKIQGWLLSDARGQRFRVRSCSSVSKRRNKADHELCFVLVLIWAGDRGFRESAFRSSRTMTPKLEARVRPPAPDRLPAFVSTRLDNYQYLHGTTPVNNLTLAVSRVFGSSYHFLFVSLINEFCNLLPQSSDVIIWKEKKNCKNFKETHWFVNWFRNAIIFLSLFCKAVHVFSDSDRVGSETVERQIIRRERNSFVCCDDFFR